MSASLAVEDLMQMMRANDQAATDYKRSAMAGVNLTHYACASLAEAINLLLGLEMPIARAFAPTVLRGLADAVVAQSAAIPAKVPAEAAESLSNVLNFKMPTPAGTVPADTSNDLVG